MTLKSSNYKIRKPIVKFKQSVIDKYFQKYTVNQTTKRVLFLCLCQGLRPARAAEEVGISRQCAARSVRVFFKRRNE